MQSVSCPHCGKEVELTEALKHEVEAEVIADLKTSQASEIEKIRLETENLVKKRLGDEIDFKIKNFENENAELKARNKESQEQMLELNKRVRELIDQNDKARLDNEKFLNDRIDQIKQAENEKAKLEKLELQKKLDDTIKALENAQKKTQQGSQQLQGEVLELDLEKQLIASFPEDEILPVPKGITGADLLQKVKNKTGKVAGTIIWEAKRAHWAGSWIPKLKEDMRTAGASEAILVVEDLPDKLKNSGLVSGVWVSSYKDALTVANTLRLLLMKVAAAKAAAENKDEKLEDLYQYIISDSFRHKIESQLESFIQLKTDLDSEKRAMERMWSKREIQLSRLERNTAHLFGDLQGITGSALPSIKTLENGEQDTIFESEQTKLPIN